MTTIVLSIQVEQKICDGIDNDCDDLIDDEDTDNLDAKDGLVMYPDVDGDGFGDENQGTEGCLLKTGFIEIGGDCDDNNNDINEGQDEYCDGADNDCNGQIDEDSAIDAFAWYIDADGDSYGDASSLVLSCFDMEDMVWIPMIVMMVILESIQWLSRSVMVWTMIVMVKPMKKIHT